MRLLRAIDYIETRLTEPLPLARLAGAVHLSPYHFSRMFRAIVGESVTSYVRRRRLTEAARRLIVGDDRVIDLAVTYGFDSQAAFSRAFKRQFGVPPGQYRRCGRPMPWKYRHALTVDDLKLDEEFRAMEPKIVTKPAFQVMGLAGEFNRDTSENIKALWQRFHGRVSEVKNAVGDHSYGMCVGAARDSFTYMAALEVSSLDDIPEGMTGRKVAAQTYAVFTVKLAGEEPIHVEMGRPMRHIWSTWLPNSGYVFAKAPDFEYYDHRFESRTLTGEVDIYIPVRTKSP